MTEIDEFLQPRKEVTLPSGRVITLQQPPFHLWPGTLNRMFSELLVSLCTEGDMSDSLLRERMPAVLIDCYLSERETFPGQPTRVSAFLKHFSPEMCDGALHVMGEGDLTAAWQAILDYCPRFFDWRRPAMAAEVTGAIERLNAVTEAMMERLSSPDGAPPSADSDSTPAPTASASSTPSRSSKRRRNQTPSATLAAP